MVGHKVEVRAERGHTLLPGLLSPPHWVPHEDARGEGSHFESQIKF